MSQTLQKPLLKNNRLRLQKPRLRPWAQVWREGARQGLKRWPRAPLSRWPLLLLHPNKPLEVPRVATVSKSVGVHAWCMKGPCLLSFPLKWPHWYPGVVLKSNYANFANRWYVSWLVRVYYGVKGKIVTHSWPSMTFIVFLPALCVYDCLVKHYNHLLMNAFVWMWNVSHLHVSRLDMCFIHIVV